MLFLITIQDKTMAKEPDIGVAVVEADTDEEALRTATSVITILAENGQNRCVAKARAIEPGRFYRTSALLRLP